jgi:hypothetical protein
MNPKIKQSYDSFTFMNQINRQRAMVIRDWFPGSYDDGFFNLTQTTPKIETFKVYSETSQDLDSLARMINEGPKDVHLYYKYERGPKDPNRDRHRERQRFITLKA